MARFTARIGPGHKTPYDRWTFLIVPPDEAARWGRGRFPVRGAIRGVSFDGFAAWGEGELRVPLSRPIRDALGVQHGDVVEVTLEQTGREPDVSLPGALASLFSAQPALARAFAALPPSAQRAWCAYIAEAKRAETTSRRLLQATVGIPARAYPR
jgi:hypothetical protein